MTCRCRLEAVNERLTAGRAASRRGVAFHCSTPTPTAWAPRPPFVPHALTPLALRLNRFSTKAHLPPARRVAPSTAKPTNPAAGRCHRSLRGQNTPLPSEDDIGIDRHRRSLPNPFTERHFSNWEDIQFTAMRHTTPTTASTLQHDRPGHVQPVRGEESTFRKHSVRATASTFPVRCH